MRRIVLATIAIVLIALIWGCSTKESSEIVVTPVAAIDSIRPTIVSTSPADGDSNVSMDIPITVVFSEAMDPATVNEDCFYITGGFFGAIEYRHDTAIFTPARQLDSATKYYAVVHLEVADTAGNHMQDNFHWWFSTVGYPDTTTPPDTFLFRVVAADPTDGAVDVPYTTSFAVTFSRNVDPLTLTDSSFFISDSMPGKITVSGNTAALTPSAPLGGSRVYTVTVTAAVADMAGYHLAENYSWSVTTEPVEIMPLAIGNYWGYHVVSIDSMGNVTADFYDTLTIDSSVSTGDNTWYRCVSFWSSEKWYSNRPEGLWRRCGGEDTIFIKFPVRPNEIYGTGLNPPLCHRTFRVLNTDEEITVPAGTFRCIAYYTDFGYYDRYFYYYAPKVGLVKYVYLGTMGHGTYSTTRSLSVMSGAPGL